MLVEILSALGVFRFVVLLFIAVSDGVVSTAAVMAEKSFAVVETTPTGNITTDHAKSFVADRKRAFSK